MKKRNAVNCPPCGENVGLPTKRGLLNRNTLWTTPHRPYRALPPQVGKLTTQGFTLIELLVVVLIIGILAAVAVPMYKRAVLKSRFTTVMPLAKAIAQGNETYYLANGEYSDQLPELDVEKPAGDNSGVLVGLKTTERYDYVLATREGLNNNYIIYQDHSPNFPQNIHCEAKSDDTQANWVCESIGGTKVGGSQTKNYTTYILQGNAADGRLPTTYNNTSGITLYAGDTCISTESGTCKNTYTEGSECIGVGSGKCTNISFDNSICTSSGDSTHGNCSGNNFRNGAKCVGIAGSPLQCHSNTFVNSSCEGYSSDTCSSNSFDNSKCTGTWNSACAYSTFTNHSECTGKGGTSACSNSTFTNYSECTGKRESSCSNSTFTNNSQCVMNYSNACTSNVYSTGAGCQATEGFTCPTGTPKTNSWDAENNTYTADGWNGGCCNPAYMVGGTCPANATVCSE